MNDKVSNAARDSFVSRGVNYLTGSVEELKKVQSPTRQETLRLTGVVVLIIVFVSMCLFVMDLSFDWLMRKMIG